MENILIKLPLGHNISKYKISSALRLFDGNQMIEMKEDRIVEIRFISISGGIYKFHYKQVEHERISTHDNFFDFSDLLNTILDDIYILTDQTGKIVDIEVQDQKEKEKQLYKTLKKKYSDREGFDEMFFAVKKFLKNKDAILEQFHRNGYYKLIFNGLYKEYNTISIAKNEIDVIEKLASGLDVPYLYDMNIAVENPNLIIFKKTGSLDYDRFQKKEFTRFLKDKTGIFNLRVDYHFEIEENYVFQENSVLKESNMYASFLAANLYSVTMAHQIDIVPTQNQQIESSENRWTILIEE